MAADFLTFSIGTFVVIIAIVNPLGATTFFVALTKGYNVPLKRRVVDKAVLAATLVIQKEERPVAADRAGEQAAKLVAAQVILGRAGR